MKKHHEGIQSGLESEFSNEVISRKIYISFPTDIFIGSEDMEFDIKNSISNFFNIPLYSIHVAGSGKTGYSYYHKREFKKGVSDLDIAVIDPNLFQYYSELVFKKTNGLRDQTLFGRTKEGTSHYQIYKSSFMKGIFRPDAMPGIKQRQTWFKFFNKLSEKYIETFSNINCGIYFSQVYFEHKQSNNIDWYKELKEYDKI